MPADGMAELCPGDHHRHDHRARGRARPPAPQLVDVTTTPVPNDKATRRARTHHVPIVDAHVHLWDPATLHYPWLDALPTLQHSFDLADYSAAVGELPVE